MWLSSVPAHHPNPLVGVAILAGFGLAYAAAVGGLLWAARRSLRRCPLCAADAIRASATEPAERGWARVALQCGQCGTWRRLTITRRELSSCVKGIARDRRRIGDGACRLAVRRRRLDCRAFIAVLRTQVAGAEDFLARTRAPRG